MTAQSKYNHYGAALRAAGGIAGAYITKKYMASRKRKRATLKIRAGPRKRVKTGNRGAGGGIKNPYPPTRRLI